MPDLSFRRQHCCFRAQFEADCNQHNSPSQVAAAGLCATLAFAAAPISAGATPSHLAKLATVVDRSLQPKQARASETTAAWHCRQHQAAATSSSLEAANFRPHQAQRQLSSSGKDFSMFRLIRECTGERGGRFKFVVAGVRENISKVGEHGWWKVELVLVCSSLV